MSIPVSMSIAWLGIRDDGPMSPARSNTPVLYAAFLIVTGAIGLWASSQLLLNKIRLAENPSASLSCDRSVLVQCSANLNADQGAAFGVPNPLLGVIGFVAPIAVGVALLAGARFARWFWLLFNAGVLAGFVFVIWLIGQSIYSLGTLCPNCMIVWSVMLPMFWVVTLRNAAEGHLGARLKNLGSTLLPWAVPIALGCALIVALLAQLELDVVNNW